MYLYGLSVVRLHHMEIEAVHPSSRSKEDAAFLVKMTPDVHQDLTETDWLNRAKVHKCLFLCGKSAYLVKVDDHGAVAHICGLVIGLACGGKCHAAGTWAHGHPQRITCGFWGGCWVTNHQAFSLQYNGLRVVLPADH